MNTIKRKELAMLLVGSLAVATPAFAHGSDDDGVNSSSGTSCSSGTSGSSSTSGTSGNCKRSYTVGGVITSTDAGLDVAISCTNMEKKKSIVVGVEIYASNGILLNSTPTLVSIDAGKSATIASDDIAAITEDATLDLSGSANPPGAAKITSTSSKIICSALLMTDTGAPASMASLPVIKGSFRKGD